MLAFAAAAPGAPGVTHRTGSGVTYEVTAEGLSRIAVGDRTVAEGGWSCFNAEHWFRDGGSGEVDTKDLASKSVEALPGGGARVRHRRGDVVCTATYTFDGEDVLISARIENRHAAEPMNVTGFRGLTFHFDRPPEGLMQVQHISYFQAHGVELCHPGHWSKFGGSYAVDGSVGVGTTPLRTGLTRTLTLWDYASWAQDKRAKLPKRRLIYFVVARVPARGANTFDVRLRVSPDRRREHLLAPYREHFRATFGEVRYEADARWIATAYVNRNQESISPANPYGLHGGFRRIDTDEGLDAFCETVIPALKEHGGQGVILWGQGGDDPRGAMYRPDFDVLPPEIEKRFPELCRRFAAAGLKVGVCTRPRHLAVRKTWRRDRIIDINPDDPGHRRMLLDRFKTMMDMGCRLFYLDSFGSRFEDVKLMRHLRAGLGRDVLTFAEHQCDAIMPYSGGYSETSFVLNPKAGGDPHYRLWSGLRNWELYRHLAPGSQMASRLYRGDRDVPADHETPAAFFYSRRITPLLPISGFRRLGETGKARRRFVDEQGRWR